MLGVLRRYMRWLHTGFPAGTVEKLPVVGQDGATNVPGLYVVGDLTGIPLLKFSSDSGARVVQTIAADAGFQKARPGKGEGVLDLVVIGGGVSGMAAALEAKKQGLSYQLLEATEPFSTIVNFPKGKPIYTYPTDMVPAGDLQFTTEVKEDLVRELHERTLGQGVEARTARAERVTRQGGLLEVALAGDEQDLQALRVVVAIGRSGNFRKLGVPGEELDKVSNRLHDPQDYSDRDVLVVGGGDSAVESAIALSASGARVTLSYRKPELTRPKPANVERLRALVANPEAQVAVEEPSSERVTTSTGLYLQRYRKQLGQIELQLGSQLQEIGEKEITLKAQDGEEVRLVNDAVFSMIGREAPLDFFRRSGVRIRGEVKGLGWFVLAILAAGFAALYLWKSGDFATGGDYFPRNMPETISSWGQVWRGWVNDPSTVVGTLARSMSQPPFYYTLIYCALMVVFGVRRVRRRRTPYVTAQTSTLILVQLFPLFLLPELILPCLGYNGYLSDGWLGWVSDQLFPETRWGAHPREYWRSYGFILAWPLMVWNVFTEQPIWGWLVVSLVQTFVILPLIVWRWGKGAYCGWICSCGGMAETLGDTHRYKMPHGPRWNRFNMLGQVILGVALALLALRILGWVLGSQSWASQVFNLALAGTWNGKAVGGFKYLSYKYVVDIGLAGVLGFGLYFHFSGRMWCRFACPLAALMHIYARFSQFRILSNKKKCISCNVCTSVCHQGIDIMNFANKGLPMEDPECVRCSACVQSCPTGVLTFGRVNRQTGEVLGSDRLAASPVQMKEAKRLPIAS